MHAFSSLLEYRGVFKPKITTWCMVPIAMLCLVANFFLATKLVYIPSLIVGRCWTFPTSSCAYGDMLSYLTSTSSIYRVRKSLQLSSECTVIMPLCLYWMRLVNGVYTWDWKVLPNVVSSTDRPAFNKKPGNKQIANCSGTVYSTIESTGRMYLKQEGKCLPVPIVTLVFMTSAFRQKQ